ncbi:MAG: phosphoribosylanthranilate isomerase [Deltaproteobacteria bacterium]|jgi:phosphoribosylanthranilate isomerase|nr:phosphoribosylanthranilate isomerase [Deltaproteobacteria bacterium]
MPEPDGGAGRAEGRPPLCKICGLTRKEDVLLCHSLGVEFTGFIFAPRSPRFISPEAVSSLPSGPALRVGVFAEAELDFIRESARVAKLDYIQLHGGEAPDFCRALGPERIIKVIWPRGLTPRALALELERFSPVCAYFLFDSGKSGGGSGKAPDFGPLAKLISPRPWFLAGGLGPETLPAALGLCSPDGVDCNSALETAPGIKDPALTRRTLALLRDGGATAQGRKF